jgi:hypothetical protein
MLVERVASLNVRLIWRGNVVVTKNQVIAASLACVFDALTLLQERCLLPRNRIDLLRPSRNDALLRLRWPPVVTNSSLDAVAVVDCALATLSDVADFRLWQGCR